MPSYQYRKSHCGDKTILRPSYLHNGISYTGKTASLYWIGALWPTMHCVILWHHLRWSVESLLPTGICQTSIQFGAWISNYSHVKQRNITTHSYSNFDGGIFELPLAWVKPPSMLGQRWVITSQSYGCRGPCGPHVCPRGLCFYAFLVVW